MIDAVDAVNTVAAIASTHDVASNNGDMLRILTAMLTVATGLIALLLKNAFQNRKLTVEDNKGLRAEFIQEMHELRDEVKGLRVENAQLRNEVRDLHSIIDGMRRGALQKDISTERDILDQLPAVSPEIRDAAERAMRALNREEKRVSDDFPETK